MNERAEINEFCALLRAKVPLILIESHEEPRILKLLSQACNLENQLMMRWSVVDGLGRVVGTGSGVAREEQGGITLDGQGSGIYQTNDLFDCLRHIDKSTQNGVYVMCDAHPGFKDPIAVRLMREIGMGHTKCARTLVFISPSLEDVPTELLRLADHFKPRLPTREDIKSIVSKEAKLYQSQSGDKVRGDRATVDLLMIHLLGLEFEDARRLVRQALRTDWSGVLGFEQSEVKFDAVGGLTRMKHWVSLRHEPFLDMNSASIDRPKGCCCWGS